MGYSLMARSGGVVAAATIAMLLGAGPAWAKDSVYYADSNAGTISVAALDGSGARNMSTAGAPLSGPYGISIDPSRNRVYWTNAGGNGPSNTIGFTNLDGSGGGGQLNTAGVTMNSPYGASVDPVAGRIYFASLAPAQVSYARLDNSGGGTVNTAGATTGPTAGVAVDPLDGRVFFAGHINNNIGYGRLDGSGGGDVTTVNYAPGDVALDRATGRLYYAKLGTPKLAWVSLDGTKSGTLDTTGAAVSDPYGVAIDSATHRIYWANGSTQGGPPITTANAIGYADLDGGGGGNVSVAGTTPVTPTRLALLRSPVATTAPVIAGKAAVGSLLSCSHGVWAADSPEAHTYRAPGSYAYRWSRDGTPLKSTTAVQSATVAGTYACAVTATNAAGSTVQTGTLAVRAEFGAKTSMRLGLSDKTLTSSQALGVTVVNANAFAVTGSVGAQTAAKVQVSAAARHKRKAKSKVVKIKAKRFKVKAHGRKTVKLALPRSLRTMLARKGALTLRVTAKVKDPSGHTRTVRATVKAKHQKPKKKKRS